MRILCTRPNASEEISGVKFTAVDGGMLSEDVPDDVGAAFLEIGGYQLGEPPVDGAEAPGADPGDETTDVDDLAGVATADPVAQPRRPGRPKKAATEATGDSGPLETE